MKNLRYITALSALLFSGCGSSSAAPCAPVNTFHAPAHRCAAPVIDIAEAPVAEAPAPTPKAHPLVEVTKDRIDILQKVQFETASAEIRSVSYGLLDEVAETLTDISEITLVRVEGHTDSVGGASMNRRLSKERAHSVLTYLVERGVDTSRLEAEGYGPDQPIDDNETEAGREKNRRVEFKILSRE